MLTLTRRRGEAIMIGDHISIRVIRVGRRQAMIGVQAPRDVIVHRGEVYARNNGGDATVQLATPEAATPGSQRTGPRRVT